MLTSYPLNSSFQCLTNSYLTPEILNELIYLFNNVSHSKFKSIQQHREATLQAVKNILSKEYLKIEDLEKNPEKFFSILELMGVAGGGSFATLIGVQLLLAAGGIAKLMDPSLKDRFLPDIQNGTLLGCFAMTEEGHGTNVPGIETVAIYDSASQQFMIDNAYEITDANHQLDTALIDALLKNTSENFTMLRPFNHSANKKFIGNACNAHFGIVFAQLLMKKENQYISYGPHAFFVPFKDLGASDSSYAAADTQIRSTSWGKFEFKDCGEKFGLNGIRNDYVRFHKVRIPLHYLMMHGLIRLSPEGEYERLVPSPLSNIYSAIKNGRTFISCTSQDFTIILNYIAIKLKTFSLPTCYIPNTLIAETLSVAVALHWAKKSLLKDFHRQTDGTLTGMKVLSVNLALEMYGKFLPFFNSYPALKNELHAIFADLVASYTYEGDNGVLPQKNIGDILLHIKRMGKSFNFKRDYTLLLEILGAFSSFFGITLNDLEIEKMRRVCWLAIMGLSNKLAALENPALSSQQKEQAFFSIWNDNQFLIHDLSALYTAIYILNKFQDNINSEVMRSLYTIFRNKIYRQYYCSLFKHTGILFEKLKIEGIHSNSIINKLLKKFTHLHRPTSAYIAELKKEHEEQTEKIAMDFLDISKAMLNNESEFIDLLDKKFFSSLILAKVEPFDNLKSNIPKLRARL